MSTTNKRRTAAPRKPRKTVKIIPLGGLDQIGQNMTLVECDDEILIVDWHFRAMRCPAWI
mgnify:CR=1 FL=1